MRRVRRWFGPRPCVQPYRAQRTKGRPGCAQAEARALLCAEGVTDPGDTAQLKRALGRWAMETVEGRRTSAEVNRICRAVKLVQKHLQSQL